MKLMLMMNLFDFIRELEVYFNCDVILSNENTVDYLTFLEPDEKFEKIMMKGGNLVKTNIPDKYMKAIKINLDDMGPYIEWKNGIIIDIKSHDIVECNIDVTSEESLVYYL